MYGTSYAPAGDSEQLTSNVKSDMMGIHGELSEWFKELVLKTSDPARDLGFESLTLRQKTTPPDKGGVVFWWWVGIRKDGTSPQTGVNKCPVDTCLVRGRIHVHTDVPSMGVDGCA